MHIEGAGRYFMRSRRSCYQMLVAIVSSANQIRSNSLRFAVTVH